MFSCKYCEMFKNAFFTGHLRKTAFKLLRFFCRLFWLAASIGKIVIKTSICFTTSLQIQGKIKTGRNVFHPEENIYMENILLTMLKFCLEQSGFPQQKWKRPGLLSTLSKIYKEMTAVSVIVRSCLLSRPALI